MFMGDSYTNNQSGGGDFQNQRQNGRNNFRGGRGPNNREGGFRIRLSDNEMRAARSLQEAFNLRSTVAVLGFAVRTLAQMLEDGSLENLVNEYRSQAPANDQRRGRGNRGNYNGENKNSANTKPNPFARPEKPLKNKRSLILIRQTMSLKMLKKKIMIKQQKQVQMKIIRQIQASKDK